MPRNYHEIDTIVDKTIGRFTVKAVTVYDDNPDFSYLGQFTNRMNWEPVTYIYDRDNDIMYDGHKWRNDKGQIVAEPDLNQYYYRQECRFIDVGDCQFSRKDKHSLKYAFQNARHLNRIDDDWGYIGIIATVIYQGTEIGHASCWGYECYTSNFPNNWTREMQDKNILVEARELVHEAILTAKEFVKGLCKVSA